MNVVAICTRGLVHSRTIEAVDRNIRDVKGIWHWELTYDLPIPQAQNEVTERALAQGAGRIWYVEEDIIPPDGILRALIALRSPVAVADYPLKGLTHSSKEDARGRLLHAGMGCLLASCGIFQSLEKPYFRDDVQWTADQVEGRMRRTGREKTDYGGQDTHFFGLLSEAGIRAELLKSMACRHLEVERWGEARTNDGCHAVRDIL